MENIELKLEKFFSKYKPIRYKKKVNILLGKTIPNGIYYIEKGAVRTIFLTKDGRELTNTLLGPHDLFPILWALYNKLPQHTFQAIANSEVRKAPKEEFLLFIKENPDISNFVLTRVLDRLEGVASRFEATLLGNASVRVATVLLFIANNVGVWHEGKVILNIHLTHQDIADMVGLTRETVTIEMDKLKNEGTIDNTPERFLIQGNLLKQKIIL